MLISKFGNGSMEIIQAFEETHGITLPEDYRKFLLKYNGGDSPNTNYHGGRDSTDVRYFYGLGNVKENFDKKYLFLDEWMERGLLPIAEDSCGDFFAISVGGDNYGAVYFCDHEEGLQASFASDTFKGFLKKCTSGKIDPYMGTPIEERERDLIARGRGANITDGLRKAWQEEIDFYGSMVQERVIL